MNKSTPSFQKSQVLVVDDEAVFRYLAKESLLQSGFRVLEAENGKQAIDIFENRKPNIVLLDIIKMPGMDGFTVCETIRNHPEGEIVPIVMITASDDIDSVMKAYDVGATDFITKPVNWQMLGHRVNFLLRSNKEFLDEIKKNIKNINLEKYSADKNFAVQDNVETKDSLYDEFLSLEKEIGPVILYELISVIKSSASDINRNELSEGFPIFGEEYKSKTSVNQAQLENIRKKYEKVIPDFQENVVNPFFERSMKSVEQLLQSLEWEDYATIIMEAMRLKNECKFLGFDRLYELCSYVENFEHKNQLDNLRKIVEEIETELHGLKTELSNKKAER